MEIISTITLIIGPQANFANGHQMSNPIFDVFFSKGYITILTQYRLHLSFLGDNFHYIRQIRLKLHGKVEKLEGWHRWCRLYYKIDIF